MRRIVTEKIRERIIDLRERGYLVGQIAQEIGLSYSTAALYVRAWELGFETNGEYQGFLARNRHAGSLYECNKRTAKKHVPAEKKYQTPNPISKITRYQAERAIARGYESPSQYQLEKMRERKEKEENRKVSRLIRIRLAQLGKTVAWLAEKEGISPKNASNQATGRNLPARKRQKVFFRALGLPYETIDEFLRQ